MAVFLAPVAAAGVGAGYFVVLSKAWSSAANASAKRLHGLQDAYPWPFWRPWFDSSVQSNSTPAGTAAAAVLAGVSFGVQRRLLWRHLGSSLRTPQAAAAAKIQDTGQFVRTVGPGVAEASANALSTCLLVGAARPLLDGNNLAKRV